MRRILLLLAALATLVVAAPALAAKVTGGSTTVTPSAAAAQALTANGITLSAIAPATAAGGAFTFPIASGQLNAKNRGYVLHRGGLKLTKGDASVSFRRPVIVVRQKGAFLAVQTGRTCRAQRGRKHDGRKQHGRGHQGRKHQGRKQHGRGHQGRKHQGRKQHGRGHQGRKQHGRKQHGRKQHVRFSCALRFHRVARLADLTVTGTTATATLKLTPYAARRINGLAGTSVVKAGDTLGTATTTLEVQAKK